MKSDIMINFEHVACDYGFDFTVENGRYISSMTNLAYSWYRKGFIDGQKG